MLKYILKRVLYIVFVFILISIIIFFLYKAIPADPVLMYMEGSQADMKPAEFERQYELTKQRLGYDQPLPIQYIKWITNLLKGDFGRSLIFRQPVINVIKAPMANTIKLNILVMIIVFAITIPLGITTAVRKGTVYDTSIQVITILGYSLPVFIIAIASIYLFAVILGWLPVSGSMTAGFEGAGFALTLDKIKHMILPVIVLAFSSLGSLTRYIRAAMIDALRMDYIRTARAKGLKEKVVIYSHAFRNSMIPFVTILIGWFLSLFSGSLVVESIFIWKGMGKVFIDSMYQLDYSVALALQMFYVILSLVGNLIVDIAYTFVDPRIRLS